MDGVTLSREQLREVVDFIEGRGFHAPHVIAEILDHFACKVEEKLIEQPGITLERAMKLAHDDFGSLGFYPFLAAYEKSTRKKYRRIYWGEMKRLVLHPLVLAFIGLSGFFLFKGYIWCNAHFFNAFFGVNGMNVLLLVGFAAYMWLVAIKAGKGFRKNKLFGTIISIDTVPLSCFMGAIWSFNPGMSEHRTTFAAVIVSFGFIYLVLHGISMFAALEQGKVENNRVLDYMDALTS